MNKTSNNTSNISEEKNKYINILFQIYSEILSKLDNNFTSNLLDKDFEEYILQNLISDSQLDKKIKQKLEKTFLEKLKLSREKQKNINNFSNEKLLNLDDTIEQEQNEELKNILKTIQYGNGYYIIKGPILGFVTNKEKMSKFLPEIQENHDIKKIGFFLKDSYEKYGFDIVISTDENIITHEYKESILELFTDEKIKKISLFNLENNLEKTYSKGEIFTGILSDIIPHFIASDSSFHILQEIQQYQKYINYSIINQKSGSNIYEALIKVNTFLNYLYKVIDNLNNSSENNNQIQTKIFKGLIGNINYPHKLLSYLTNGNIDFEELTKLREDIENNIKKQDEIIGETDYKIFNILSSNNLNIRYCTIITHMVKETIIEHTENKDVKIITTPLNIENSNLKYILNLYLTNLKNTGKIKNFSGDISDKMFIIDLNNKENEIKINSDGFINFEVEITTTSKQEIIVEVERKDEFWGNTTDSRLYRSLGEKELSREVKDSEIVDEKRDGLSDEEIDDFTTDIETLEQEEQNKIDIEIGETTDEINLELSNLMENLEEDILINTQNLDLTENEEDLSTAYGYVFDLYEVAIMDSINELNIALASQYKQSDDDYNKYLYKQLKGLTTIKEDSNTIVKRIAFDRLYEIGSENPDKVEIDIIYDKKTKQITIKKDWQGMCSAHQVIDASLEQILNNRWGIDAKRIDQKEINLNRLQEKKLTEKKLTN